MELEFTKLLVKMVVQPAGDARQHGHGPMNRSEGHVARSIQAREVVKVGIRHDDERIKYLVAGVRGKMGEM